MAKETDELGYEVGHGKPPVRSRFQKGQSGNPSGRPKGSLNIRTVVAKALRERVIINQQGRRRTVTKLHAIGQQVVNKSASGDMSAFRQLVLLLNNDSEEATAVASPAFLEEADQKVINTMLQRLQQNRT